MTKELTRFEFAAVKRVAANTKSLKSKVEKIDAKIAELNAMRNTYVSEIRMWESPIVDKYGHSVESILDGSYLNDPVEVELPGETFEDYTNIEVYTEYTTENDYTTEQ